MSVSNDESIADSESIQESVDRLDEDIITIAVATDIHLGYAEKNAIRGQDTFVTLEEVLKTTVEENADFLLLGGDLFHETRPSTHCLYKCVDLLKKYCLSDRPVSIEFLSDPTRNFVSTGNDPVNYENPNLNIGLPVFSIHGNHDDPTGEQQISALNLLSSTGLVNYFGKYTNQSQIKIEPILLKKGETKIALYGLSHIKDEKLARMFLEKKVIFMSLPDPQNWFNLLVLHQNRAHRGAKNFIPDNVLPDFLDFIIWGHEHDCRIEPEQVANSVYISQPGSTVATSLSAGESIPKHMGILKIHKKHLNMSPRILKTVRPFIFKDIHIDLDEIEDESLTHQAFTERKVEEKIEEFITEAEELGQEGNLLPLLRLNVELMDEKQSFNSIRFGQKFIGRVANPEDMIKLRIRNKQPHYRKGQTQKDDFVFSNTETLPSRVEDLVQKYFENEKTKKLKCYPLKPFNDAVIRFIDTHDNILLKVVDELIDQLRVKMTDAGVDDKGMENFLADIKLEADTTPIEEVLRQRSSQRRSNNDDDDVMIQSDNDNDVVEIDDSDEETQPLSSRATTSRAKTSKSAWPISDINIKQEISGSPKRGRGKPRGRGRGKASAQLLI